MTSYRLTPQARQGLQGILEYVSREFGSRVAGRVLDELEAAFERLGERPGIGYLRADLTPDPEVRFWPAGPSLIAYRVQADVLEVLFVERGEKDRRSMLDELL